MVATILLQPHTLTAVFMLVLPSAASSRSQSQSHIAIDDQSVSLGVEHHLGLVTRYLLLFDSYGLVSVRLPL
jgi:hypothetical protein